MSGQPDPKSRTLARGARRYRRKVASPKQWQAIIAAKGGPCRCCNSLSNGRMESHITFHRLVPRAQGGDDVPDNIVPVCLQDHELLTRRNVPTLLLLCASLTDAEYAYCVAKVGEDGVQRLFGIQPR